MQSHNMHCMQGIDGEYVKMAESGDGCVWVFISGFAADLDVSPNDTHTHTHTHT